jgi:hypothetical protein
VNHVPDTALAAIDDFGEGVLTGAPPPFAVRLRSDLRLQVRPQGDGTARCRYETEHTEAPSTLRDRGSFVTTILDGVDERFRAWGIDPPDAYTYAETVDGWHRYEGVLRCP